MEHLQILAALTLLSGSLAVVLRAIAKLSDKVNKLQLDVLEIKSMLGDAAIVSQARLSTLVKEHSKDMFQVLTRKSGTWVRGAWVQKDSPAYKAAYDCPGKILVGADGTVEKGVQ